MGIKNVHLIKVFLFKLTLMTSYKCGWSQSTNRRCQPARQSKSRLKPSQHWVSLICCLMNTPSRSIAGFEQSAIENDVGSGDSQAYQPSRICCESHDLSCNLKVSQAAISISWFLAAVANSHRLSAQTYGFASPSSRLFGHISQFQAHGCDFFFFGLHLAQAAVL